MEKFTGFQKQLNACLFLMALFVRLWTILKSYNRKENEAKTEKPKMTKSH